MSQDNFSFTQAIQNLDNQEKNKTNRNAYSSFTEFRESKEAQEFTPLEQLLLYMNGVKPEYFKSFINDPLLVIYKDALLESPADISTNKMLVAFRSGVSIGVGIENTIAKQYDETQQGYSQEDRESSFNGLVESLAKKPPFHHPQHKHGLLSKFGDEIFKDMLEMEDYTWSIPSCMRGRLVVHEENSVEYDEDHKKLTFLDIDSYMYEASWTREQQRGEEESSTRLFNTILKDILTTFNTDESTKDDDNRDPIIMVKEDNIISSISGPKSVHPGDPLFSSKIEPAGIADKVASIRVLQNYEVFESSKELTKEKTKEVPHPAEFSNTEKRIGWEKSGNKAADFSRNKKSYSDLREYDVW